MGLRDPDIERLLAAFRIHKADRVPHWELEILPPTLEYLLGRRVPYLDFDQLLPADQEVFWTTTGRPYMGATSWALEPADCLELYQRWPNDAMGVACYYMGTWGARERGSIRGWEDLGKLRRPTPVDDRRRLVQEYIRQASGTTVGVAPVLFGPLMLAYEALGVDGLAYKVYDDRKFVVHLLDHFTKDARAMTEAVDDLDIDYLYFADDVADNNGPFLHPKMMEELWLPRVAYIVEPIKARGVPIAFHCCGNLTKVIPWLLQLGFSAIHPVQPNCNDIYSLKRQYGEQICLIGNIEVPGCLSFGTVDDVVRETREHIDRLAYNGGYVCASSHSIVESVKPENYVAMLETIIEYGAYSR